MDFYVFDRKSMERGVVIPSAYIVVSIRDPDKPVVSLPRPPSNHGVLQLAFHDAEPAQGFELPSDIRLMQPADAEEIWAFVQQHRDEVGAVVCHCEQGMSRSPAVAIALAEALDGDPDALLAESQPNQYVLRLMREAIKQTNSEE